MTAPPAAPVPDRPFPTAPPPSNLAGPAAPAADDIDIPLDGDPEPPPETAQPASDAMAAGIIAPPADSVPRVPPVPPSHDLHEDSAPPSPGHDEDSAPSGPATAAAAGVVVGRAAVPAPDETGDHPATETTPTGQPAPAARHGSPWGDFGGRTAPDERAAEVITGYPSARPGPAAAIHGVGITVLVTDLSRSIAFYRDVLGFFEIDSGESSAVLASGDTRLVLRTVHNLDAEAGRLISLNLEVGDVDAVHDELRAKGVKFVQSPRAVSRGDKLELWSATFRDPDNHNIAITQWRAVR